MRKTALYAALVAFASVLTLSSCDAMFNTNLFKAAGLGQFDISKADLSTNSAIQDTAASSPTAFYDQLSTDSTTKTEVITKLTDPSTATPDSLVLAAAIEVNTTDAGYVVDNIASQLPNLMSTSSSGTLDTAGIISAVLPSDIDTTQATAPQSFVDMINGFLSASNDITTVVNSGSALPAVPGGTNQDTAYIGLVSLAVSAVQPTSGTVADAIWASIYDPNATASFTIDPNVFDLTTGSTASTLLSAAGIDPTKYQ